MRALDHPTQEDLFGAEIIPLRLAITAMRDSGYKNTAYALAELIDNAVQANATVIEVHCIEKKERVRVRERRRLWQIGVLDNGSGMDARTLRMALQFGNGSRLDDRTGIGRFGMGLPNASISQAARVDVWTWQNGPENAITSYVDLEEIDKENLKNVPNPILSPVPTPWRNFSAHIGRRGTLVVWSNLDFERLTWKRAARALLRTQEIVGRVYRRFIHDQSISIRLFGIDGDIDDVLMDQDVQVNDPLYLIPTDTVPPPFNTQPMFTHVFDEEHEIEYKDKKYRVIARYSLASMDTVSTSGTSDRGSTSYGRHAATNIGVSVLRAGREIMLDHGWCIGYDPRERWWGAEVEFPPELDEVFGVTNNKQAATHFSELATTDWKELAEEGELFMDVVERLKDDGDPRGWLLDLSDSIHRNLTRLRVEIKGQSAGRRSTKRVRHGEADDVTKAANKGWKERSREQPLAGDADAPTKEQLDDIREDLTNNKKYSEADAEQLIHLIKDADLKVIFLEADFPDAFQLFNVELKGNITEITFNRQHPAFDDIFGTIATVDEDVSDLEKAEVIERLTRAINAGKIIFAAWGRYEREAGVDRARALQKVRFDWGQIAAKFLQSDEEFVL